MAGHLIIRQRIQPQPASTYMNGNVNSIGSIMITDDDFMNSYKVNIPKIGFDMSVDESQMFGKRWQEIAEQLAYNLIDMKDKNKKLISIRDYVKQPMIDMKSAMRRIEPINASRNNQSTSSRISQQSFAHSATQSQMESQLSQSLGSLKALSRGDQNVKQTEKESLKESSKDISKNKGKEKDKENENPLNVSSSNKQYSSSTATIGAVGNILKFESRQASSESINSTHNLTPVIVSEKEEQPKAYFRKQSKEMPNVYENTLNFIEKIGKEINEKISEILSIILPNLDKFIANDLLLSIKYLIQNHKLTYHKHIHSMQMRQSLQQFVILSPTSDDEHESSNLLRMADNTDNTNVTSTSTTHNLRNFTAGQGSSRDQLSWKQQMVVSSLNENEQESNTNNRNDSNGSVVKMNDKSDSSNDNNDKKVNPRERKNWKPEKVETRIRGKSTSRAPGILFNDPSSRISHESNRESSKSKPKLGQSQSIIYFLPPVDAQSPSLDSTYQSVSQSRTQSQIDNSYGTNASELSSPQLLVQAIPESADNRVMEKSRQGL